MTLCEFCTGIFSQISSTDGNQSSDTAPNYFASLNPDTSYRPIKDALQNSETCNLCQLVSRSVTSEDIQSNYGYRINTPTFCRIGDEQDDNLDSPLSNSLTVSRLGVIVVPIVSTNYRSTGFSGPLLPSEFEEAAKDQEKYVLEMQLCSSPIPSTDSLSHLANKPSDSGIRVSGRLLGSRVHLDLCRHWVHLCETTHGETCNQSLWPPHSIHNLESLLLIDVERMCVVNAPEGCQYATLSYCWGTAPTLQHVASNTQAIRTDGALRTLKAPRTISDAIEVTRGVGLKYLWVDALCIIQDDISMKLVQLAQMGLIYSLSSFNIIAASGNHSDYGLVRLREGSGGEYQETVDLGGRIFLTAIDGAHYNPMQESPWITRAWTMQEKLLSKRSLIFTDRQVYWVCWKARWLEEVTLEEFPAVNFVNNTPADPRGVEGSFRNLERGTYRVSDLYEILINDYIKRQLSFQSDILNAFSGISQALSALSGLSFYWGLPESCFARNLYWTIRGTAARNHATCPIYDDNTNISTPVPFPSWSWAAWVGRQSQAWINWTELTDFKEVDEPEIVFYRETPGGKLKRIGPDLQLFKHPTPSGNESSQPSNSRNTWICNPRTIPEEAELDLLARPPAAYLHFWTSTAKLYIRRDAPKTYMGSASSSRYSFLPKTPGSLVFLDNTDHIPFQGAETTENIPEHISLLIKDEEECDVLQVEFAVIGRSHFHPRQLLTLAVEWKDGVAYRIGIARIEEAWWVELEQREWKRMLLA
ncbi:heterokaryon incompatibility protein-domain-containing protein [Xylogone sp. PMI_703]|nr:heterokaryon incompatibility protein-domain-containing protein [Xylogone sp. PMI_703]